MEKRNTIASMKLYAGKTILCSMDISKKIKIWYIIKETKAAMGGVRLESVL